MPDSTPPVDYQALFRALPENLLLLAPDATILDNTDCHAAVSLKARAEVLGRPLFEAYPSVDQNQGDEIERSHEHVRRFREAHTMPLIRYDLELPAEQGGGFEEMYWQATHYPVLNEAGDLQAILQRTQNVTAQVRAEREAALAQAALTAEQDRARFILENLPVLMWTNDATGAPDSYNARWQAYTGLHPTAGFDWQAAQVVHPDDEARVVREMSQAVQNGREFQVEFRLRRHDGQYRWLLARNVPRLAADGRVTMWVGGGVDVHEQKLLVQELLEAAEQQAALSEQSYQTYRAAQRQRQTLLDLFMDAPAMISIVRGPNHRYEFANTLFMNLVGGQSVVGRTVAEVFPELVSQGIVAMLDGVYRTGEPVMGHELPVRLAAADGSGQLRDAYFNFVYQRFEENGVPAGITAYSYEVTELVQTRQALERLRRQF